MKDARLYNPAILEKFASIMYARATLIIVIWTIAGFLVGLVAGIVLGMGASATPSYQEIAVAFYIGLPLLGALLGAVIGQAKAFWLKLEAQKVLCQLQTEINTRPSPVAPSAHQSEQKSETS